MEKLLSIAILCTFIICSACKDESPPRPEINESPSLIVHFKQAETKAGYLIEGYIPWPSSMQGKLTGHQLGLDFFISDDDDGGHSDTKLSWQLPTVVDSQAAPSEFGKITLVKAHAGLGASGVPELMGEIEIDGMAESIWDSSAVFSIEKLISGAPVNTDDISASFRAYWDSSGLYLLLEIQDEKKVVDSHILRTHDDGIAIFFDPQNTSSPVFDPKIHTHLRIVRGNGITFFNDFKHPPEWIIPKSEIFDGGPGKDGIPSLDNPVFLSADEADYLNNNDLILGIKQGNEIRAYPHRILDWHEIINDEINGFPFAVTYCPLTGTGIGWGREIDGQITSFGVSGLLYNTNLIPYDRLSESNWTQIGLECVNGSFQGRKAPFVQLVETSWKNWKEMYPHTLVVSNETGFGRDYSIYPYGNYKTDHSVVLFPISPDDTRMSRKTRVHGIIVNEKAKVYTFSAFKPEYSIVETNFQGEKLVIIGSRSANLIVSFFRELEDGTALSFTPLQGLGEVIMQDNEGNSWNVFGEAISGPRQGQKLQPTESYMGYWMAFGSFYPKPEI